MKSQVGQEFENWHSGGELRGMTKMLADGRTQATQRLTEEARARGANAVIAFRFDTSELGGS
ncbi:MAG TPA: heavy metal-binding domain-containing protein [Sporichthyaceae bacterium]|nr:heavy metal-binding domain-containing protein [Sporichthyaceae bacterium]